MRSATSREHERTREWFINDALPKAVRVAQRSAYDVLRAQGAIIEPGARSNNISRRPSDDREVGKYTETKIDPRRLSDAEIRELASSCLALLATQGQAIDKTLSEISIERGGFLFPEDSVRVRAAVKALIVDKAAQNNGRECNVC